jgi:hypothetical protein
VRSREELGKKMQSQYFQYKNVKINHLYPSCALATHYIKLNMPDCKKVRYIGMDSMGDELRSHGIETIGGTSGDKEYKNEPFKFHDLKNYKFDNDVKAVVCGIDL